MSVCTCAHMCAAQTAPEAEARLSRELREADERLGAAREEQEQAVRLGRTAGHGHMHMHWHAARSMGVGCSADQACWQPWQGGRSCGSVFACFHSGGPFALM